MPLLFDLFLTFFKIGAFTFGGGYAMLSLIENACVEKKGWITHEEMMNVTIIGESTPGPISINCATYVGFKQKGFLGAIVATLGMVTPSFVIIFAISQFLNSFLEITIVANAFKGIKLAVGILVIDASFKMIKKMKKEFVPILFASLSFIAMMLIDIFAWDFSSIYLLLIAGVASAFLYCIRNCKKKPAPAHATRTEQENPQEIPDTPVENIPENADTPSEPPTEPALFEPQTEPSGEEADI